LFSYFFLNVACDQVEMSKNYQVFDICGITFHNQKPQQQVELFTEVTQTDMSTKKSVFTYRLPDDLFKMFKQIRTMAKVQENLTEIEKMQSNRKLTSSSDSRRTSLKSSTVKYSLDCL